jgi:hypothetical protein
MAGGDLWARTLDHLRGQMAAATFNCWLISSTGELAPDGALTVTLPSANALEWVEARLRPTVERAVEHAAGAWLAVRFRVAEDGAPAGEILGPSSGPSTSSGQASGRVPSTGRTATGKASYRVELVSFDPTVRGWVMTANYAWQFWQPYLGVLPFALWNTLRSFPAAYQTRHRPFWPTIQTLAEVVAGGDRHAILGRAGRAGRGRREGALEVLERERVVWVASTGLGSRARYTFRVLDHLPLLTPQQMGKLSRALQARHARELERCDVDRQEWEQLTLPTLAGAMSRT